MIHPKEVRESVPHFLTSFFFVKFKGMEAILLIFIFFLCIAYPLWKWYQPKIEVVVLVKHYRVYLWYNKYDGAEYRGRVYKYLFEI